MIIKEHYLERLVKCPLMVPNAPSKAETCTNALASWVLRQSFLNKFKGRPEVILHDIRGKVLDLWGDDLHAGSLSRTAAFRFLNLHLDFEVIHLEQPYNLILSGYTIQGQYALLRSRRGECLPHVLILHDKEPDMRKEHALPPDVITLARYVHICTNSGHKAHMLHFPVFMGKSWLNKTINLSLATLYLESMLKVVALNQRYPVMGSHCSNCSTKPCLDVFNE